MLVAALAAADNGDTITLGNDISATSNVTFDPACKTVTIDGGGHMLTGPDTSSSSQSYGLMLGGINSSGTVNAIGGPSDGLSSGVINGGGTISVTTAAGGNTASASCGVSKPSGTVNVTTATGGTADDFSYGVGCGAGTVNVAATGGPARRACWMKKPWHRLPKTALRAASATTSLLRIPA